MPKYEPEAYEIGFTVKCRCGELFSFRTWDINIADNPYVDVVCKCETYYKKMSDIKKNNAVIIKRENTGREM